MTNTSIRDCEAAAVSGNRAAIEVAGLKVTFGRTEVVHGVSFEVAPGEIVAIVGESGAGKSVVARALLGMVGEGATVTAKTLQVLGKDILSMRGRELRKFRGAQAALIMQDALGALDPLVRVGKQVTEALAIRRLGSRHARADDAVQLLGRAQVPEPAQRAAQLPGELSGGLRQRALVASALALDPPVLIADEPTTALDVTTRDKVLELLHVLAEHGRAILLISHDLDAVRSVADRVIVMRDGQIVEAGPASRVISNPQHEYTKQLIGAIPTGVRAKACVHEGTGNQTLNPGETVGHGAPVVAAVGLVKTFASMSGTKTHSRHRRASESAGGATGARRVLDGVDITIADGESVGLVGASGVGKSTLLDVLLGITLPDAGSIAIDGVRVAPGIKGRAPAQRATLQQVPQDPLATFDPRMTTERILHESLARKFGEPIAPTTVELAALVGLGPEILQHRPARMSGGQRQRVAIARAISRTPRVLLCDEPVSALDVTVQAEILELLQRLQATAGMSMLFVSHDPAVVAQVSDRILHLENGRLIAG